MICNGIRKDGDLCHYKAKYGERCGYHREDGYHKCKKIKSYIGPESNDLLDTLNDIKSALKLLCFNFKCHFNSTKSVHKKLNKIATVTDPIGVLESGIDSAINSIDNNIARIPLIGKFVPKFGYG